MENPSSRTALAVTLGAIGTVVGYSVPIVGPIAIVIILLFIIGALFDDNGALAGIALLPFRALATWLDQKDGYLWIRRAPFIGLVLGTFARWFSNQFISVGAL